MRQQKREEDSSIHQSELQQQKQQERYTQQEILERQRVKESEQQEKHRQQYRRQELQRQEIIQERQRQESNLKQRQPEQHQQREKLQDSQRDQQANNTEDQQSKQFFGNKLDSASNPNQKNSPNQNKNQSGNITDVFAASRARQAAKVTVLNQTQHSTQSSANLQTRTSIQVPPHTSINTPHKDNDKEKPHLKQPSPQKEQKIQHPTFESPQKSESYFQQQKGNVSPAVSSQQVYWWHFFLCILQYLSRRTILFQVPSSGRMAFRSTVIEVSSDSDNMDSLKSGNAYQSVPQTQQSQQKPAAAPRKATATNGQQTQMQAPTNPFRSNHPEAESTATTKYVC